MAWPRKHTTIAGIHVVSILAGWANRNIGVSLLLTANSHLTAFVRPAWAADLIADLTAFLVATASNEEEGFCCVVWYTRLLLGSQRILSCLALLCLDMLMAVTKCRKTGIALALG